jgi:putative ABC transport system permease protein
MNIFSLSWKNLIDKKLNSFLCVLLLTLGIGIISFLLLINKQLQDKFMKNIEGIDMVVGAKGSPLQLILSAVYQIDSPTGNIPMEDFQKIAQNPMVKKAIPMSMGDNFKGFRIIGTNKLYAEHFKGEMATGMPFKKVMEVNIGAKVATSTGLKLGDSFASSHGLDAEGEAHEDQKFVVKGILKENGTVLDNVILTPLSSIWQVHDHGAEETEEHHEAEHDHSKETPEEHAAHAHEDHAEPMGDITAGLLMFRNKMGIVTLPRVVNESSRMQSAVPAPEINRLFSMLGVGVSTLQALALAIMLVAGVSVFISLYNALKERKYEMALMLSMGATRGRLFLILLLEGLYLTVAGFVAGILLSRLGLWLASAKLDEKFHFDVKQFGFQTEEGWLFAVALLIGIVAAALPSLGIYKLDISKTLAED